MPSEPPRKPCPPCPTCTGVVCLACWSQPSVLYNCLVSSTQQIRSKHLNGPRVRLALDKTAVDGSMDKLSTAPSPRCLPQEAFKNASPCSEEGGGGESHSIVEDHPSPTTNASRLQISVIWRATCTPLLLLTILTS